jgi:adenylate cyclase
MSKPLAQFSYDIWGDRVNIASRLQTHELPNAVHVSDPVFERLKARFEFEDTRKASR